MANHFILTVLCISSVLSNITIRRTGWLDRVVEYYKNRFYNDLKKAPLVKIKARIERPPPGYIDSNQWDYKSVLRLLTLIRNSEDAVSVRRAIKGMKGTRRFLSLSESFKYFPSLAKNSGNDFYYPFETGEYYADVPADDEDQKPISDNDIIIVTNPVEARLPSARISVQLLRHILETRAEAGRYMTTTVKTFSWLPISFSKDNFTQDLTTISNTDAGGGGGGGTGSGDSTGGAPATTAAPAA